MPSLVKYLVIAVILFSLAASGSWYLQMQQTADPDAARQGDEKQAKAASAKSHGADSAPSKPLLRPSHAVDPERVAQLSATLQHQQEAIKAREQHVVIREKQMDLIHDNIKHEHKKLDQIRKEIRTELQEITDKLEQLELRRAEVDTKRQQLTRENEDLEGKKTEVNGLELANVKKLATIYDKMDPEAGAQNIEQMVDKGKLDMAVVILANMGQRQAAGLLSEVSKQDPGIAVQLIDRMRYYKNK